jgi:Flp pilus assembly protein TadG
MKRRHRSGDEAQPVRPRRFWPNRAGNIALITALMMIPLTFALGMAFDFTLAQSRKDKLDGIADAAALGGVAPAQMSLSPNAAAAQSKKLFNGQAGLVSGVASAKPTVSANDATVGTTVTRTVVVTYTAKSQNVFASLLGMSTMTITGSSTAKSSTAPNIDFYLLLDTSPSMEIAATSGGITAMQNATQQESDIGTPPNGNGCAFGCHQSNPADLTSSMGCVPHTDPATGSSTTQCQFLTQSYQKISCAVSGNYADGTSFTAGSKFPETGRDNYDLSRCLGVILRIDLLNNAAQNLMTTAASMATSYHTTYRMALYLTDKNQANAANDLNLYTLQSLTSNLALAQSQAATITALAMYQNNHLVAGDANSDMDTYLDAGISALNGAMPAPGNGTNTVGDTPQEVLFIVTDGLNDMTPTRTYAPMDWSGANCAAIKARGIRIAVLYTTYEPLNESWYLNQVVPALPAGLPPKLPAGTPAGSDPMALAAQQCASSGLYYEVSTDGDISAALQALFQKVVTTARLTQ